MADCAQPNVDVRDDDDDDGEFSLYISASISDKLFLFAFESFESLDSRVQSRRKVIIARLAFVMEIKRKKKI